MDTISMGWLSCAATCARVAMSKRQKQTCYFAGKTSVEVPVLAILAPNQPHSH